MGSMKDGFSEPCCFAFPQKRHYETAWCRCPTGRRNHTTPTVYPMRLTSQATPTLCDKISMRSSTLTYKILTGPTTHARTSISLSIRRSCRLHLGYVGFAGGTSLRVRRSLRYVNTTCLCPGPLPSLLFEPVVVAVECKLRSHNKTLRRRQQM